MHSRSLVVKSPEILMLFHTRKLPLTMTMVLVWQRRDSHPRKGRNKNPTKAKHFGVTSITPRSMSRTTMSRFPHLANWHNLLVKILPIIKGERYAWLREGNNTLRYRREESSYGILQSVDLSLGICASRRCLSRFCHGRTSAADDFNMPCYVLDIMARHTAFLAITVLPATGSACIGIANRAYFLRVRNWEVAR